MIDVLLEMLKNSVGIIGYRNHSKKLLDILIKDLKIKKSEFIAIKKILFKLKKENKNRRIIYTDKLRDLKDECYSIFISSPSDTHFKYLNYFAKADKYIFVKNQAALIKLN